jgi:hypothetical protein
MPLSREEFIALRNGGMSVEEIAKSSAPTAQASPSRRSMPGLTGVGGSMWPVAGSIAGGAFGAIGGPAGMWGGSALGAAGGEGLRQMLAEATGAEEPRSAGEAAGGMTAQGLMGLLAATPGAALGGFQRVAGYLRRNPALTRAAAAAAKELPGGRLVAKTGRLARAARDARGGIGPAKSVVPKPGSTTGASGPTVSASEHAITPRPAVRRAMAEAKANEPYISPAVRARKQRGATGRQLDARAKMLDGARVEGVARDVGIPLEQSLEIERHMQALGFSPAEKALVRANPDMLRELVKGINQ